MKLRHFEPEPSTVPTPNAATESSRCTMTLAIRDVVPATPRTFILRLELGGQPFSFHPGQAVFVGVKGSERRTPYSIAASPADLRATGCLELLVRADQPDGLPLLRGIELDVDGPVGNFTFPTAPATKRFVFVAGGTGIAPVRAMLREALSTSAGREIRLLYSARTPDEFAYQDELRALAEAGQIQLWQTITRQDGTDGWSGHLGRIEAPHLEPHVDEPATQFFICGPVAFVGQVGRSLLALGVSPGRVVTDQWR